jgi:hypothetical protein
MALRMFEQALACFKRGEDRVLLNAASLSAQVLALLEKQAAAAAAGCVEELHQSDKSVVQQPGGGPSGSQPLPLPRTSAESFSTSEAAQLLSRCLQAGLVREAEALVGWLESMLPPDELFYFSREVSHRLFCLCNKS